MYHTLRYEDDSQLKIVVPTYYGNINCFFIENLAIEKDYEPGCLYLIMAAFEYFPGVDYSVLLLPYGTRQLPLMRQYFTPIPDRPFSAYEKELFVFHKSTFNRTYQVKPFSIEHLPGVRNLIMCSCLKDYLLNDLDQCLEKIEKDKRYRSGRCRKEKPEQNELEAVTLISENQVLGIAIVTRLNDVDFIQRFYEIGTRISLKYHKYSNFGLLLHCVLHPIAKFLSSVFLKEAMRLTERTVLCYKIHPSEVVPYDPSYWQSLCNVLDCLIPLKLVKKVPNKPTILLNTRQQAAEEEAPTKKLKLLITAYAIYVQKINLM
ncbi:cilia- and flagella-associated protein 61 [Caerostris extrusa]|uniref:Cilia- and flagella-associated protein 61 n=1 Tax=Caerostris extrusa TaxID=172846 RepID=A0AAV4TX95_CAEEX|nr:cilia- and flagella-associated protein 61 [Caerostris extrusa]